MNGAPHIGHAYTSIAADVLARFKRLDGCDVFFLTGTDEHGQKVENAPRAEAGIDPQTFADQVSADFRDMAGAMDISFDDFIRTTEAAPQGLLRGAVAADAARADLSRSLRGLVRGPRRGIL